MKWISASRRTDIPAFYSEWFLRRIRAGFCAWVNPFNGRSYEVSLRREDVAGIVFWTRFPKPMLPQLDELAARGYPFYFHVTVNGYGRRLEPRNPELNQALDAFRALSGKISPRRVIWRYDPIVLGGEFGRDFHLEHFEGLARRLAGCTERCYISFLDLYGKTQRNLAKTGVPGVEPEAAEKVGVARQLAGLAGEYRIALHACCEDAVVGEGVLKGRCVDPELLEIDTAVKRAPTRAGCGCCESVDIGAYDTCSFGCAYCYATNSYAAARKRAVAHDPSAAALWTPKPVRESGS